MSLCLGEAESPFDDLILTVPVRVETDNLIGGRLILVVEAFVVKHDVSFV